MIGHLPGDGRNRRGIVRDEESRGCRGLRRLGRQGLLQARQRLGEVLGAGGINLLGGQPQARRRQFLLEGLQEGAAVSRIGIKDGEAPQPHLAPRRTRA